jgi:hypothetical protein
LPSLPSAKHPYLALPRHEPPAMPDDKEEKGATFFAPIKQHPIPNPIPIGPPAKQLSEEELRVAKEVDELINHIRQNEHDKAAEMLDKEPNLVNGLTFFGATPLVQVVCMGKPSGYPENNEKGVRLLFERGADPTIEHVQFKRDAFGYAEKFGDADMVALVKECSEKCTVRPGGAYPEVDASVSGEPRLVDPALRKAGYEDDPDDWTRVNIYGDKSLPKTMFHGEKAHLNKEKPPWSEVKDKLTKKEKPIEIK